MQGGDADEFIHFMNDGEASVRHKSISVEKYRFTGKPFEEFMEMVYYYESDDAEDVLNHLTEDILWDGKTFYELEKALTWIDW